MEPSFFKTTLGIHCHALGGRHLVWCCTHFITAFARHLQDLFSCEECEVKGHVDRFLVLAVICHRHCTSALSCAFFWHSILWPLLWHTIVWSFTWHSILWPLIWHTIVWSFTWHSILWPLILALNSMALLFVSERLSV